MRWVDRLAELPLAAGRRFAITASEPGTADAWASLPPDLAPCPACRGELAGGGRRHRYPFTSCTRCGPCGSIAPAAPWDRVPRQPPPGGGGLAVGQALLAARRMAHVPRDPG